MRVPLLPGDVDCIVFWTRNPRPLFPYLEELDDRGYRYYFQYTLLDYPPELEPGALPLAASLETFQELAHRIGPERVIWRYDPVIFSPALGAEFHQKAYERIARALKGYTRRSVISIVDLYPRLGKRLNDLGKQGFLLYGENEIPEGWLKDCMISLARTAGDNGMEITSCAERSDVRFGIQPGKCIDDRLIRDIFGIKVTRRKDPGQRKHCGCVISRDIGVYDTCVFGCRYCYATTSFQRAAANHRRHDPVLQL